MIPAIHRAKHRAKAGSTTELAITWVIESLVYW